MDYEIRLTAFLDILGFGKLVESSADDPKLTKTIYEVLSSIDKNKVQKEAFIKVNHTTIPTEELEEVIRIQSLMVEAISRE